MSDTVLAFAQRKSIRPDDVLVRLTLVNGPDVTFIVNPEIGYEMTRLAGTRCAIDSIEHTIRCVTIGQV